MTPTRPKGLAALLRAEGVPARRRRLLGVIALLLASASWLPLVHLPFVPTGDDLDRTARDLASRQLALIDPSDGRDREIRRMRGTNAEWDFMGRTYLVLALANMSLRQPDRAPRYLDLVDRIIDDTLRLEREKGIHYFLMEYARSGVFITDPPRSLFIDGEIALMMGARRLVEEKGEYRAPLRQRVDAMVAYMERSPVLSGESYPDECWTFCNTVALASIRIHDVLDGRDHSAFLDGWIRTARKDLVDPDTGLLVSSYSRRGQAFDGPEGSSIWMAAHCLQVVDADFARDQYARAKRELSRGLFGFGWAGAWPRGWKGPVDVDSGPVIPVLDVSAGSSGLAFVGAAAFDDREYLASLMTTLDFAAFPERTEEGRRYCASNQVGDAVLLYALVLGPLWDRVDERMRHGG